jgi:hypothetical protein
MLSYSTLLFDPGKHYSCCARSTHLATDYNTEVTNTTTSTNNSTASYTVLHAHGQKNYALHNTSYSTTINYSI